MEIKECTNIFKLLGDETRLTMLKLMETEPCCVCEFTEIFQMSQPAISQHIRKLKDAQLIEEERRGQWKFYALNLQHPQYDMLLRVLQEVACQKSKLTELEAAGLRISCC